MTTTLSADFPLTGVAYVAQIENEHMGVENAAICNTCYASGQEKLLRRCTGCKLVNYCSRECQKKQWPKHKDFCALVQGRGDKNNYLSRMSDQRQVYRVLIDSYRLRCENDHKFRGEDHGIYYQEPKSSLQTTESGNDALAGLVWAKGDATDDFQKYLDLAEDSGVLPAWWSFDERMACLELAVDREEKGNIFEPVDHQVLLLETFNGDLASQYALRIIAELVAGYDGKGAPLDDSSFHKLQAPLEPEDESVGHTESANSRLEGAHIENSEGLDDDEEADIPLNPQ